MTSKERFLSVLDGKEPDRTPNAPLLMDFSIKRIGANYRQFTSDGSVMAEAQLAAAEKFPLDAITACSDPVRIVADLGGEVIFPEDKTPYLATPLIKTTDDFYSIKKKRPDVADKSGRMYDRGKGVSQMVREAGDRLMVLGWVDMPFAEACVACGLQNFMYMLYDEPELAKEILAFLTEIVIEFALAQLEAGATMIGAGDAAASLLSPELYKEFALPYETAVCEAIHKKNGLVNLHICGDTTHVLEPMATCGADLFDLDHLLDFNTAITFFGQKDIAFKGNLDPVEGMLLSHPEEIYRQATAMIKEAKGLRYMLCAGCEIPAAVSDEAFMAFCQAALDS